MQLSVVIPCYNEEEVFPETSRRILSVCREVCEDFEIIFVDDGSRDRTWELIVAAGEADARVKGLKLSRNHGHQVSLTAGLSETRGEKILMLDADLQDPPELLPDMIAMMDRGYDVVYGKRRSREGESWFKKTSAKYFYRILRVMAEVEIPVDTGDFRLVRRRVLDEFLEMKEKHRFVRGMFAWLGHRQIGLEYDRQTRFAGETKYPLTAMLRFATDALTSFSTIPLRVATTMAYVALVFSAGVAIYVIWSLVFYNTVQGWASVLLVLSFFSGVQLLTLGIVGAYIGRIYMEVKGRPMFIIDQSQGLKERESGDEQV